jgi:hypothetical protein
MDSQNAAAAAETCKPRGTNLGKPQGGQFRSAFFALFFFALWLTVCVLAAEAYARYAMGKYWEGGYRLFQAHCSQITAENSAEIASLSPGKTAISSFEDQVAAFAKMDDVGRLAWAQRRHEMAVTFNDAADIVKTYVPSDDMLLALGGILKPGENLKKILPHIYAKSEFETTPGPLLSVINTERLCNYRGPKDLSLPDGRTVRVQLQFRPLDPGKEALLCIRESIWKTLARRFRTNVEFTDNFEWGDAALDTAQFRANNVGFRGADIGVPKPEGFYRILCIGGSTTIEGVTDDLTYPALLQQMLRDQLHTDRVEVVNCGIYGGDTFSESETIPDYIALQPDMVVYYNFINDFRNICGRELQDLSRNGQPFGLLIGNALRRSRFVFKYLPSLLVPTEEQLGSLLDRRYFPSLGKFAGALREAGVETAFCSFVYPDPAEFGDSDKCLFDYHFFRFAWTQYAMDSAGYAASVKNYNDLLRRFCEKNHLTYLPVAENFPCRNPALFNDICHMAPPGIRKKAGIVFDLIRERVAQSMNKPK